MTASAQLKSTGPITFSPDGVLFVADNVYATITAFDLRSDTTPARGSYNVEELDTRLGAWLGCPREDVFIRDVAVHPRSGRVYLSVMRGAGSSGVPLIVTVAPDGSLAEV